MTHLYQTKFYVLNLYFWGEAHVSPFLTYMIFFKVVVGDKTHALPL